MKGYSIITDFGCKNTCPYCIWKDHKLNNKKYDNKNYLTSVESFINNIPDDINKFSISGGGDPLNNFDKHLDFWSLVTSTDKKIDIHTSYTDYNDFSHKLLEKSINRLVFHLNTDIINSVIWDIFRFSLMYKIRINFVVTKYLNIFTLEKVEKFAKKHDIQISYRQLVSTNPQLQPCEYIEDFCKISSMRYPFIKYVYQSDYNMYLMPDGKTQDKFLF